MIKTIQELYAMSDQELEDYIYFLGSALRSAEEVRGHRF